MGPNEWIAALSAAAGFIAWMTAMWIRAGRILQRIDDMAGAQAQLNARSNDHESRITRLEVFFERDR